MTAVAIIVTLICPDGQKCPRCGSRRTKRTIEPVPNAKREVLARKYTPVKFCIDRDGAIGIIEARWVEEKLKPISNYVDTCSKCGHVEKTPEPLGSDYKRDACPQCGSKKYYFGFSDRYDSPLHVSGTYNECCADCHYSESNAYEHTITEGESGLAIRNHARWEAQEAFKERRQAQKASRAASSSSGGAWRPAVYNITVNGHSHRLTQVSKYSALDFVDEEGNRWTKTGGSSFRRS